MLHKRSCTVAVLWTWVSFALVYRLVFGLSLWVIFARLVLSQCQTLTLREDTSFSFPSDVLTPLVGVDRPESYHSLTFGVSADSVFNDRLFSLL